MRAEAALLALAVAVPAGAAAQDTAHAPRPPAGCQTADTASLRDELLRAFAEQSPGVRLVGPLVTVLHPGIVLLSGVAEPVAADGGAREFQVTSFTCVDGAWRYGQRFSRRGTRPTVEPSDQGILRLAVTPDAEVFIDGRSRGVRSRVVDTLPLGEHQVRLVPADGSYADTTFAVVIGSGEAPAHIVRLRRH